MLVVLTTGYVIACIDPFLSNYSNNDASIMQNILHRNTDDIKQLVEWGMSIEFTMKNKNDIFLGRYDCRG